LNADNERRHLWSGPWRGEQPEALGIVPVIATCPGGAAVVIERAQHVMDALLRHGSPAWPSDDEWRSLLPAWFVAQFHERSAKEHEEWLRHRRTLPPEEARAEAMRDWGLGDWLFWLEPRERQWHWWDARVEDYDTARVEVQVYGFPMPFGALEWLLRASGATDVDIRDL
jgi:hypothetical protein